MEVTDLGPTQEHRQADSCLFGAVGSCKAEADERALAATSPKDRQLLKNAGYASM
jgi:hypothetical protein